MATRHRSYPNFLDARLRGHDGVGGFSSFSGLTGESSARRLCSNPNFLDARPARA